MSEVNYWQEWYVLRCGVFRLLSGCATCVKVRAVKNKDQMIRHQHFSSEIKKREVARAVCVMLWCLPSP